MNTIKIALDWTVNINHIGLFVAQDLGYYHEIGMNVQFINPSEDNYNLTPGKKLDLDLADLALAPFETVISLNNKSNPIDAIAVFAILQNDLSSLVSLKSSGINSPKDLDKKIYASYKARYEDQIVKEMVVNDGGRGELVLTYPEKLGIWNTLLTKEAHSTWIFDNWEGVEAESQGIELTKFRLNDYSIPYGYSPVILGKKSKLNQSVDAFAGVIQAIRKGYGFAAQNPKQAVELFQKHVHPADLQKIDISRALAITKDHFGSEDSIGKMNPHRVHSFLQWLVDKKLEDASILTQNLFSNFFLNNPAS
jgi:ABC-type nitrate/sulfonate/bicarbonate transport system substrate-binding protein